MLVLARRVGESIVIGDSVTVSVLGVEGGVVRLGIAAPEAVAVARHEIFQQVRQENRRAAQPGGRALASLAALRRAAVPDGRAPGGV